MENLQSIFNNKETFIEEWHECYISESKITGFVCTFQLSSKTHKFYGLNDIRQLLKEASKHKKDVYLSLNAFEYGQRTTNSLKQIRNIGVDIDCYKLNISVEQALEEIKQLIIKGSIPNPNVVIFSGRGLQLLYSLSGGASPKMAFLSQYITAQFIAALRHLGADTTATDVTRIFRLPYSVNTRSGKQVTLDIWRALEYNLSELYSYCVPLDRRRKVAKKKTSTLATLPSKKGLMNVYSLNTAKKNDLEELVKLRKGNIEKRNVLTYIYAYTVALLVKNKEATFQFSRQLNERLATPQKASVVKRTSHSAYEDAMEFFEEFKKRDFKMWYKTLDGIKRPMKSQTIIDELEITTDEMKRFSVIIDEKEKKIRNAAYQRKKRRDKGVKARNYYIEEQYERTNLNLHKLQQALEEHPKAKRKELAEMLGVSVYRIDQLKRQLKSL
ncbi:AsnC family protein [Priestia aryabhattai]|uniref:AsnC family protein n=1 Tax=Priestia aryabhattai TaxID=412384 RepID=UPI003D2CCE24